ncbi:hypothetical protein NDU88_009734 [Pleurodeles waltl]|uniref:Lamina-associated polypeptide 2 alpha C-terminal domain-containing protein n=1 Tax=Pleurodeles waltl TaxID=8319 RepID=A0AAV7PSY4_PLEWA|nr:hypothetical protein NDU88_009734 [Pleurodeles waltl]
MANLYPLEDMGEKLPDSMQVVSVVASLVGRSSMAEENTLKDGADKKVDSSVKVYARAHPALRADVYRAYVSQSLLPGFKTLLTTMQEGGSYTDLLESMEQQAEFLSDIAFDSVRVSALSSGASVAARRNLYLKGWNMDAAQRYMALRLPFVGSRLFGHELEEKLHCVFKELKHSMSFWKPQKSRPSLGGSTSRSIRQPSHRQAAGSQKYHAKELFGKFQKKSHPDPGTDF